MCFKHDLIPGMLECWSTLWHEASMTHPSSSRTYLPHHKLGTCVKAVCNLIIIMIIMIIITILIITPHQCMYLVQSGGQGTGSSQGAGLEQRIQQTLQGAGSALQQSLRSIQGKHTQQRCTVSSVVAEQTSSIAECCVVLLIELQHCTVSGGIAKHTSRIAKYSVLYCCQDCSIAQSQAV